MLAIRNVLWVSALCLAATSASVQAQAFPTRPIRLVVGFTPGGGVDINARLLAAKLSEQLGQPVVIDNRPGAGTNIANEYVARATPDGYTLLMGTPALAINMALYKNLSYDTLRDFVAVSMFSQSPNILVVNSSSPARSMGELIALARAKPGVLNYSSAGAGTTQHLAGELFKLRAGGLDIVNVPYKGIGQGITDFIGGQIPMLSANATAQINPDLEADWHAEHFPH